MLRIARAALAQSGDIQKKAREAAGDILDGPFDPDDYEAWPEPDEKAMKVELISMTARHGSM